MALISMADDPCQAEASAENSHNTAQATDTEATEAEATEAEATEAEATEAEATKAEVTEAEATEAEATDGRPRSEAFSEEDFCCPICLDVMVRPVVLTCSHRLCRGCWLRMLQGGDVRATANLTGSASCPLGRCERFWLKSATSDATARCPVSLWRRPWALLYFWS